MDPDEVKYWVDSLFFLIREGSYESGLSANLFQEQLQALDLGIIVTCDILMEPCARRVFPNIHASPSTHYHLTHDD